ncbi:MAG: F0F1 ATP synthase subunit B [Candidatus Paceibacterota bacterium]|jgi:F-type H+-transporting ATPase subunit b
MQELISTFHIDWKLLIAQAVNFGIVFTALYFFAVKPIRKLMDERSGTIAGGLENAKKHEDLLRAQEVEYESTLVKARAEASLIMKDVKKDAEQKRAEIIEKAQADSMAIFEAGKKQLNSEKQKMLDDAKKELVSLVMNATEKVLGESVNGKVESKLVEESIKSIN